MFKQSRDNWKRPLKDNKYPYLSLLEFRNTPTDTDTSAILLMSRELRSIISVTREKLQPKVVDPNKVQAQREAAQAKRAINYNEGSKQLPDL